MNPAARAAETANPRSLPQPLTSICAGLAILGIAAFLYGLASDPQTAWLAFHTNFVYYATLSQAGLIIACIFTVVGARWPGPLHRIAEALAAWIPVTLLLACIGYFGGDTLFEWKRVGPAVGKEAWLNPTRFYVTEIGVLALFALTAAAYLRASLRPTLKGLAETGSGFARNMAARWTAGWQGEDAERERAHVRTRNLAPGIILLFAFGYTAFVYDQVMSMEQTWYSNLFGVYVSWGGILCAVSAIALISILLRKSPGLEDEVTSDRLHDIGKLLFAFSIFWMYLFFSQYLVIWYGNLPEETQFFYDRLGPQFMIDKGFNAAAWAAAWSDWDWDWARLGKNYGWLSMAVWLCCWIIPFWALLGQRPKKTPAILGPVAGVVLLGFWLERNLLIWPSVLKEDGSWAWLGPIPLAIAAGFFGAFTLVFLFYTRVFPSLAVPKRS